MLGRSSYSQDYVSACRKRFLSQLKAFDALAKKADTAAFAQVFFCDLILALEMSFVHRLRKNEGKDGNRLNEVRMIAASILEHDGVMSEDSTIKWKPENSVTGLKIGAKIVLTRDAVETLVEEFFGEILEKYA